MGTFLQEENSAVQFIGNSGCGKTTCCISLQHHFSHSEYYRIPCDERLQYSFRGDPLVLDELQFLPERMRLKIFRKHRRLIIGTHADLISELYKAGFDVLTIYPENLLSPDSLHSIVKRRVEFARRTEGEIPGITIETVNNLYSQYGSNVRAVEHELYKRFQILKRIENV